jgi:hypothetical protein
MHTTKRELLALLEPYDDDIIVEVGPYSGEAGTQHSIIGVVYATGSGRCAAGSSSAIILFDPAQVDTVPDTGGEGEYAEVKSAEEIGEDCIECPFCGEAIIQCPHCKEVL